MSLACMAVVVAAVVWKAATTDPMSKVSVLNPWGVESSARKTVPFLERSVGLVSDEGKVWIPGDSAHFEFQLLTDSGDAFGLPLKISLKRNPYRSWEISDNLNEHYASLPIVPPVAGKREAGASCPPEDKSALESALELAAANRRANQVNDCALLANTLAKRMQGCGLVSRNVAAWANPQNSYDAHSLLEVFSKERGKWLLIDPTFVGYYSDADGNPISASEAYRLSARAALQPDSTPVRFNPLPGGLSPDLISFGSYYLSPITMLRYVAIGYGPRLAVLGAMRLPRVGEAAFFIPPQMRVSEGVLPPIIDYTTAENQLARRIGRETSGLVRLTSEGGVVSDGGMVNPDLVSPTLMDRVTWSAMTPSTAESRSLQQPKGCRIQLTSGNGIPSVQISAGSSPLRVRIDFRAEPQLAFSFRTKVRALTQGIGLEYPGFLPLFDTRLPVEPGNWQIETTPFSWASTERVSLVLDLPPHAVVALAEVTLISAKRDELGGTASGFNGAGRYRYLIMKYNLRRWLTSWL